MEYEISDDETMPRETGPNPARGWSARQIEFGGANTQQAGEAIAEPTKGLSEPVYQLAH